MEAVTSNQAISKPEPTDRDADELEEMRAQVWAAGATLEDSAFIARMLWRNGIRFTKVQMDFGMQIREPTIAAIKQALGGRGELAHGQVSGDGLVKSPATAAELDAILNSNDDRPIKINPDGSISPL